MFVPETLGISNNRKNMDLVLLSSAIESILSMISIAWKFDFIFSAYVFII